MRKNDMPQCIPCSDAERHSKRAPCSVCGKHVSSGGLRAMGGIYHRDCFVCVKCHKVVEASVPFADSGNKRPICGPCLDAEG